MKTRAFAAVAVALVFATPAFAGLGIMGKPGEAFVSSRVQLSEFSTLDGRRHSAGEYQLKVIATGKPHGARAVVLNSKGQQIGELKAQLHCPATMPKGNFATFQQLGLDDRAPIQRISVHDTEALQIVGSDGSKVQILLQGSALSSPHR